MWYNLQHLCNTERLHIIKLRITLREIVVESHASLTTFLALPFLPLMESSFAWLVCWNLGNFFQLFITSYYPEYWSKKKNWSFLSNSTIHVPFRVGRKRRSTYEYSFLLWKCSKYWNQAHESSFMLLWSIIQWLHLGSHLEKSLGKHRKSKFQIFRVILVKQSPNSLFHLSFGVVFIGMPWWYAICAYHSIHKNKYETMKTII